MRCLGGASGTEHLLTLLRLLPPSLANKHQLANSLCAIAMVAVSWQFTLRGIAKLVYQIANLLELAADGAGPGPGPADVSPAAAPGLGHGPAEGPAPAADDHHAAEGPGHASATDACAAEGPVRADSDTDDHAATEDHNGPDNRVLVTELNFRLGIKKGKFHKTSQVIVMVCALPSRFCP